MTPRFLLALVGTGFGAAQVIETRFSDAACSTKALSHGAHKRTFTKVAGSTCFTVAYFQINATSPMNAAGGQINADDTYSTFLSHTCTGSPTATVSNNILASMLTNPQCTCQKNSNLGLYTKYCGNGFDPLTTAAAASGVNTTAGSVAATTVAPGVTTAAAAIRTDSEVSKEYFSDDACTTAAAQNGIHKEVYIEVKETTCVILEQYALGATRPHMTMGSQISRDIDQIAVFNSTTCAGLVENVSPGGKKLADQITNPTKACLGSPGSFYKKFTGTGFNPTWKQAKHPIAQTSAASGAAAAFLLSALRLVALGARSM